MKNLKPSPIEIYLEEKSKLGNLAKGIQSSLAKYTKISIFKETPKPGICHISRRNKIKRQKFCAGDAERIFARCLHVSVATATRANIWTSKRKDDVLYLIRINKT